MFPKPLMTSCTGKVLSLLSFGVYSLDNNYDFSPIGSELQNWSLYFSLPVLHGILSLVYCRHWGLFVCALHILNSDSINNEDMCSVLVLHYIISLNCDMHVCVLVLIKQAVGQHTISGLESVTTTHTDMIRNLFLELPRFPLFTR